MASKDLTSVSKYQLEFILNDESLLTVSKKLIQNEIDDFTNDSLNTNTIIINEYKDLRSAIIVKSLYNIFITSLCID